MGFFSWHTQDTDKSIANNFSERPTFRVYMTDDKGNQWMEESYDGYGVFGGMDYFELVAKMNGLETRSQGIDFYYDNKDCLSPNLSESADWVWKNEQPKRCADQGYFYDF